MLSRRALFIFSFIVAAIIHGLLLYLAPQITILRQNAEAARAIETIEVQFRIETPEESAAATASQSAEAAPAAPTQLATRPGSVEDLIEDAGGEIVPDFLAEAGMADLGDLAQRAEGSSPSREFDLAQNEDMQKRVDAKVLEISREDARRGLNVARRLVRPSSDRILSADEFPALRNTLGDAPPDALQFDLPSLSLLMMGSGTGEGGGLPARLEAAPMPSLEPGGGGGGSGGTGDAETTVARAPVQRAVEQAREQSAYGFLDDMLDIELTTFTPAGDAEGYFQLRIVPKQDAKIPVLPKELIFVIDSSNSIVAQKLKETAQGVQNALKQLRPEDTFNIVAFSDTPSLFRAAPVPASPGEIDQAQSWLASLNSQGETDIYQALLSVLRDAPAPDRPRVVLVLSDGRPTAGVKDSRAIINGLTTDNQLRNSVYAFAGGNTVNQPMLDLLAYRNKGAALVVGDIKGMDKKLQDFTALLKDPILINLDADYGQIKESTIYPQILPDFYRAQVVTVYGRFNPQARTPFTMRLTGTAGQGEKEVIFRADLAAAKQGTEEIARRWGFQKAYDIIGEISSAGETAERLAELRALSRKYSFRTSYDE